MITSTELITLKLEAQELMKDVHGAIGELCADLHEVPADQFFAPHYSSGVNKTPEEAKRAVLEAYRHIFYDDDQKPNESRFFVGAVTVPGKIVPLVEKVNQAKLALKQFLVIHRDKTVSDDSGMPEPITARFFENTDFARVHRLQATRSIHILEEQPKIVSFTLRTSPQIVKLKPRQVMRMLHNNDQGTAADNYAKSVINNLDEEEIVAWRKPVPPKPRANIFYEDSQSMTTAVLPLMIVDQGGQTIVKSNPLRIDEAMAKQGDRQGNRRRSSKLMDTPLIEHPEIYRYRENVLPSETQGSADAPLNQTSSHSSA